MKSPILRYIPFFVKSIISTRLIPKAARIVSLLLMVSLAAFPAAAAQEAIPAEEKPAAEGLAVVAIARAPAPNELIEKVMTIARQVQPGSQTEMLPFIIGGMLGDPGFQSVSATENIGVVFIMHEGDVAPVVVVKLFENSPLRDSLEAFEMAVSDHKGWTLAHPEGLPVDLLNGNEEALVSAVRAGRRYDIEFTADGSEVARLVRDAIADIPSGDIPGMALLRPILEVVVNEASDLHDLLGGFNLSRNEIEHVYALRAAKGSALAAFFDQDRPSDLDFARFIPADEGMAFLGGFDVEATRIYIDHVMEKLAGAGGGEAAESLRKLHSLASRYLDSTNGASGTVLSLDQMAVQMTSVAPTTFTDEQLLKMLSETAEVANDLWLRNESNPFLNQSQELLANAHSVDEIPVHVLKTTHGDGLGEPQEVLYAVFQEYLLSASDLGRIAAAIAAIKSGEPVENNLASRIRLEEDVLFEFQMDLLGHVAGAMSPLLSPESAAAFDTLQARELRPVSGSLMARGGEAVGRVVLPVDTIVALRDVMTAVSDEPLQEGTDPGAFDLEP